MIKDKAWYIMISICCVLFVILFSLICINLNNEYCTSPNYHKYIAMENDFSMRVRDKDLLTPEQQRILVRDGYVYLEDGTVVINNLENIVYLNEGGLEHGNQ